MTLTQVSVALIASAVSFAVGILAAWELDARARSRRRGGMFGETWRRR